MTTTGTSACYKATGVVYPQDITAGPDGALWFTDGGLDGRDYSIGRITTAGHITLYPITHYPGGITAGPDGALWFTLPANNAIGRITTTGAVRYFYGSGIANPGSIVSGPDGALWFTNQGNNTIGRITASGRVSHYAGPAGMSTAGGAITAGPGGTLWFTNPATNMIGRITNCVPRPARAQAPAAGAHAAPVAISRHATLEGRLEAAIR